MNPLSGLSATSKPPAWNQPIPGLGSAAAEAGKIAPDTGATGTGAVGAGAQPGSFDSMLRNFVQDVGDKQIAAGESLAGVLNGQQVPLHQAMLELEEASVSFQLMVEVRNRLLDSYQELMRMQV